MNKDKFLSIISSGLPALLFFSILVLFYPYREAFQLDSDEGVNLMKAFMVQEGYALYDDIWSDQPPLLTIAIRALIELFGARVGLIRTSVLLVSSLMFLACYQILKMHWGTAYAVIGAVILFLHPTYAKLSTSIMVGLPSIAFVFFSLYFLQFWHRDRNYPALVLSAVTMTISVGIKIFTGFMGVIIVGGLFLAETFRAKASGNFSWPQIFKPAVLWGLVFSAGLLSILFFIVGIENASQLIGTHVSGTAIDLYRKEEFTINYHLINLLPTFFLAGIGTYLSVREKNWYFLYFTTWSVVSYLLLLNHSPVWFHHQLLVSAPAAVLAAIAVGHLFEQVKDLTDRSGLTVLVPLILIGIILLFFDLRVPNFVRQLRPIPTGFPSTQLDMTTQEEILLKRINLARPETNWFLTDLPMYAFRIGLPVPPELAAFTMKRFHSGELTEEDIIEVVNRYAPEQILLGRTVYPEVERALAENYFLLEDFGPYTRYFLRNDLTAQTP